MALTELIHPKATDVDYGLSTVDATLPETVLQYGTGSTGLAAAVTAAATQGNSVLLQGSIPSSIPTTIPAGVSVRGPATVNTSSGVGFILNSGTRLRELIINNNTPNSATYAGIGVNRVLLEDLTATGSVTYTGPAAYSNTFLECNDVTIRDLQSSGYTGGVDCTGCNRVTVDTVVVKNTKFHTHLGAGGYGVIIGGCNSTTIRNLKFIAGSDITADGYDGRHALYLTTYNGSGCSDTLVSQCVFDYTAKTTQPAQAINIRSNNRAIYEQLSIIGTGISGNAENGNITGQLLRNSSIFQQRYANGPLIYGVSFGTPVNGFTVAGISIVGCNITNLPKGGTDSTGLYGIEVAGTRWEVLDTNITTPTGSSPIIVRGGSTNLVFRNLTDGTNNGTQPFFVFEAAGISNVKISGIKTDRPMFQLLGNVTDLTVDFPRMCTVVSLGVTQDTWSLVQSVQFSGVHLLIQMNSHVTQAAVDAAVVGAYYDGVNPVYVPVVVQRTGKALIVRFYNTTTGAVVNASSLSSSVQITLNS